MFVFARPMTKANAQVRMDGVAAHLFIDIPLQEKEDPDFSTRKQYQP